MPENGCLEHFSREACKLAGCPGENGASAEEPEEHGT
jgi:hypothetical protein